MRADLLLLFLENDNNTKFNCLNDSKYKIVKIIKKAGPKSKKQKKKENEKFIDEIKYYNNIDRFNNIYTWTLNKYHINSKVANYNCSDSNCSGRAKVFYNYKNIKDIIKIDKENQLGQFEILKQHQI